MLPHRPFHGLRQLQPVKEPDGELLRRADADPVDEVLEDLLVHILPPGRTALQIVQNGLRALDLLVLAGGFQDAAAELAKLSDKEEENDEEDDDKEGEDDL